MATWTRGELASGFQHYQDTVRRAGETGDWNLFADLFTQDAVYYEHAYGRFEGREQIRPWIIHTMTTFPGSCMPWFPIRWSVLDEERGWIVCDIRNLMRDPGDGSEHEASNFTLLHYAGGNQFSYEEDTYNPAHFLSMVRGWSRVADAHGTLPADGRAWLDALAPGWNSPR
jgi:hypothetical protein